MIIMDALGWWYSRGWVWALQQLFVIRIQHIAEFFSLADLLKTLFKPFRQDVINTRNAPIGVQLQAFGGNIISRIFGLIIRTTLIITGLFVILFHTILAVVAAVVWPLLPASPFVAVALIAMGVGV